MKLRWMIALALVAGAVFSGRAGAQGMSSANYSIPVSVINSGGGTMTSANYTLIASIGEPVVGAVVSMKGDVNRDGFVNAADVKTVLRITEGAKNSADADVDFGQADAVPDSKINLLDALTISKYMGSGAGMRLDAGFLPAALQ